MQVYTGVIATCTKVKQYASSPSGIEHDHAVECRGTIDR